MPAIRKAIIPLNPAVKANGICVLTWSIWSLEEPAEDNIVVSEIGEQWSPKIPPLNTAAIHNAIEMSIA